MNFLTEVPVAFINTMPEWIASVVVFIASLFSTLVLVSAGLYIVFRPLLVRNSWASVDHFIARARDLVVVGISVMTAYIFSVTFKEYFGIGRPDILHPGLEALVQKTDFGFPSSHAAVFMALSISLFFIRKRAGYFFLGCAVLIGIARVLLGVHTPLDVLGGYILGASLGLIVSFLADKLAKVGDMQ